MNRILHRTIFSVAILCLGLILVTGLGIAQQKEKANSAQKGWLGVAIQDINTQTEKKLELKSRDGVLVNEVERDSPAESAGIKEDDIIVQFGAKIIKDVDDLQNAVAGAMPESKVPVVVLRKGEKKTLDVAVGKQPSRKKTFAFTSPGMNRNFEVMIGGNTFQGMSLRELNDQLAQYFGVTEGTGALVWEVEKGSAAEKAGLKAGDVITTIGKKKIRNLRDVGRALGIYDEGEKAELEVVRKGTRQTVSLEVEESDNDSGYNFWFDGPSHPRRGGGVFFNQGPFDIDVPEIDIENIRPKMDQLKVEMDQLRNRLQDQSIQLRERIEKEVKPMVRVHGQESI